MKLGGPAPAARRANARIPATERARPPHALESIEYWEPAPAPNSRAAQAAARTASDGSNQKQLPWRNGGGASTAEERPWRRRRPNARRPAAAWPLADGEATRAQPR